MAAKLEFTGMIHDFARDHGLVAWISKQGSYFTLSELSGGMNLPPVMDQRGGMIMHSQPNGNYTQIAPIGLPMSYGQPGYPQDPYQNMQYAQPMNGPGPQPMYAHPGIDTYNAKGRM